MVKLTKAPTLAWLRLSPAQTRVMLVAWSADTVVCRGRNLNVARRLERRGLLDFVQSMDGGLRGEFRLSDDARAYPPSGLKALLVRKAGRAALADGGRDEQRSRMGFEPIPDNWLAEIKIPAGTLRTAHRLVEKEDGRG